MLAKTKIFRSYIKGGNPHGKSADDCRDICNGALDRSWSCLPESKEGEQKE